MNLDQSETDSQCSEENARSGEDRVEKPQDEVVLAATILETTDNSYFIDINGAQYEIASSDVIDTQAISPKHPSRLDSTDAVEPPDDVEVGERHKGKRAKRDRSVEPPPDDVEVNEIADGVSEKRAPQIVLIRVNRNVVLYRRIPVQAALLAAVGTWMQIVLPAAEAA
jgi:hypothetical protein